jgi:hypothetical protein
MECAIGLSLPLRSKRKTVTLLPGEKINPQKDGSELGACNLKEDDNAGPNPCEVTDATVCADSMPRKILSLVEYKAQFRRGPS